MGARLGLAVALSALLVGCSPKALPVAAPVTAPLRVVTLMPSLAELAAEVLGDELERIVGVSEYTDYPPALKARASIGPYPHVNIEKITQLKPDLVLASKDGNSSVQVTQLQKLGFNVVVVETGSFDQILASMKTVARALGRESAGVTMAGALEAGLSRLAKSLPAGVKRPRVLLQLGSDPLISVGRGAFLNEALERVGAENVLSEMQVAYPKPSIEWVIKRDPEVIIVLALGEERKFFEDMARGWSRWEQLTAVKQKRVIVLHADGLLRPSSRLLEGLGMLKKAVDRGR